MKVIKLSLATLAFGFPLVLVGCTDSGTVVEDALTPLDGTTTADSGSPPGADSGSDANPTGDSSSPQPGNDAGSDATTTDSGNTVTDSGATVNDGGDGGGLCAAIQGSFQATQVTCNGADAGFPTSGVTWDFTVSGTSGTFDETIEGCGLTSSGTVSCSNGVFTVLTSNENSCNPAGCAIWGAQCTQTPNAALVWTISNVTATTFLATSQNEPDGGPTPLTTCTSLGDSNPIQVTWTKQ